MRAAALALVACLLPAVPQAAPVRVTFVVEAPAATPADARLWISGDLPALGSWSGAGVALAPLDERRWAGSVTLESDTPFEFKVTRGGWETVEKDARGGEIANRRAVAGARDTLVLRVETWRDQTEAKAARPSTLTGDVRRHLQFPSRCVRPRDVLVWLPPGYGTDSTRRYPAVYFHDGNNVFDEATSFKGVEWGVDEAAARLIGEGKVRPFIAVAVYNTPDRVSEYTTAADPRHEGGKGADYQRFLVEELKPFVDASYRTLTEPGDAGVVGSSLGGLISLDLSLTHPDVFGLVGCVSPAAWWAGRDMVRRAALVRPAKLRVWLDIGTAEGTGHAGRKEGLDDARALRDALLAAGCREGPRFHYEEVEGAVHDEGAWAARVGRILVFLLGPPGAR